MAARVSIVVAVSEGGVIGLAGTLPWRLSADLRRFKQLTWGHALVMGRRTYDSIGRPLPGRTSIVLTHRPLPQDKRLLTASSLEEALDLVRGDDEVFVIGGRAVFEAALPLADRLYWTAVHAEVEGDVRFPEIDWSQWRLERESFTPADADNEYAATFRVYDRVGGGK